MSIFLLWRVPREAGQELEPLRVASSLQAIFSPLFAAPLSVKVRQNTTACLVVLELPAPGWKAPFFQYDEQTWALAIDYPLNAADVLAAHGIHVQADAALPTLCRQLEVQPRSLLKDLSPPFSLLWSSPQTGATFVQNDGLGQAQLFEYQDGQTWALSNKVWAFAALGLPLEPDPQQWAVRAALDWFPLQMSGFKRISFLEPATQLCLDASGVRRSRHDVLADWVQPRGLSPGDCLELARTALLEQIRACQSLWEKPSVGLSGGWDSRAVVASLRAARADFSARVRGLPGRHDVLIASQLARSAGFPLKVQNVGGLPPSDAASCRRSIERALLWQAGHMTDRRHKTFLASQPYLEARRVSITGQHGEIGRRERALFSDDQAKRLRARELTQTQYAEQAMRELVSEMPPFTRPGLREVVQETIRAAYHQADHYGLTGLAGLDFLCLYEFTRRKGSTVHAWQTRLLIAPFLTPNYIRAVFGYVDRSDPNAFHRHIIQVNAPDWVDVPFAEQLEEQAEGSSHSSHWKQPRGRENYDGLLYWQTAGKPLIDEALTAGGFWTEVFDPDLAARHWRAQPDALAVLHLLPSACQSCSIR